MTVYQRILCARPRAQNLCFYVREHAQEPDAVDKVHHCPYVSGKVYVRKKKDVFTFVRVIGEADKA